MQISRIDIDGLFEIYLITHRQSMQDYRLSSPDGYTKAISPVHQMWEKFGSEPLDFLDLPNLIEERGDPEDSNGAEVCALAKQVLTCDRSALEKWVARTPDKNFFIPCSTAGVHILTGSLIYPDVGIDGIRRFTDLHDHQILTRWRISLGV